MHKPWMIFSMEILQLSRRALWERVQQEFQENAVLTKAASFPAAPEDTAPDAVVERSFDGGYRVRLLDDWLANFSINSKYTELFRQMNGDLKIQEYLKCKIQSASWLQDSIANRSRILEKLTKAIVAHQQAFLDMGAEHIKPLKMKLIADEVNLHITTVSRAVDDKWLQTPQSIILLRRFF